MDKGAYWDIVEAARADGGDASEVAERVVADLRARPPEVVFEFVQQQGLLLADSYSWELWGAAYIVNGGCSDDGFDYFRGWLLAQGRAAFEAVVAAPDSLADLIDAGDEAEGEDMLAAGASAYKALTGSYPKGAGTKLPALGEGWDFDDADEMKRRYPRCWAKFNE